jgi:anti-anti-sigma regulatory factor
MRFQRKIRQGVQIASAVIDSADGAPHSGARAGGDDFGHFLEALSERFDATKPVILDLTSVPHLNSAALDALRQGDRLLRDRGGRLLLAGVGPELRSILGIVKLDRAIVVFDTLAAAVEDLTGLPPVASGEFQFTLPGDDSKGPGGAPSFPKASSRISFGVSEPAPTRPSFPEKPPSMEGPFSRVERPASGERARPLEASPSASPFPRTSSRVGAGLSEPLSLNKAGFPADKPASGERPALSEIPAPSPFPRTSSRLAVEVPETLAKPASFPQRSPSGERPALSEVSAPSPFPQTSSRAGAGIPEPPAAKAPGFAEKPPSAERPASRAVPEIAQPLPATKTPSFEDEKPAARAPERLPTPNPLLGAIAAAAEAERAADSERGSSSTEERIPIPSSRPRRKAKPQPSPLACAPAIPAPAIGPGS